MLSCLPPLFERIAQRSAQREGDGRSPGKNPPGRAGAARSRAKAWPGDQKQQPTGRRQGAPSDSTAPGVPRRDRCAKSPFGETPLFRYNADLACTSQRVPGRPDGEPPSFRIGSVGMDQLSASIFCPAAPRAAKERQHGGAPCKALLRGGPQFESSNWGEHPCMDCAAARTGCDLWRYLRTHAAAVSQATSAEAARSSAEARTPGNTKRGCPPSGHPLFCIRSFPRRFEPFSYPYINISRKKLSMFTPCESITANKTRVAYR